MDELEGIWRLVDSRAWDGETDRMSAPYGAHPMGQLAFSGGRMLAALCNGDPTVAPDGERNFSSYGGPYTFDGTTIDTTVDVASDLSRIGSHQLRVVVNLGDDQVLLRPPARLYGNKLETRELIWERVWRPQPAPSSKNETE